MLLLGGVLLIVVLALVVLQSSFFQSAQGVSDVQMKQCKAAAQQASACYDQVTIFNGSKSFDMLGYAANPLLCNCSDYNPDAFTVSVGQAGLTQIGFSSSSNPASSVLFSSLSFDDVAATADTAPTTAYAFSVPLPSGKYQFFLVQADKTITSLDIQTVTTATDGRFVYSWDSLPSGSHVKVNPLTKITDEQKTAAKGEKDQTPAASELEKQAGSNAQNKDVKTGWSLKLLTPKDGKLRAIYTYAPTVDYADGFSMTVPIAANRILKTHPASSSINANPENSEASDLSWDRVTLKEGQAFRVIIEFKPDAQDATALSAEVDAAIGKIKDKELAHKKGKAQGGCLLDFLCSSKNDPTPIPPASANTNPSVSPQDGASDFISEGQGCAATSGLPGSLDKKCATGLSCQAAGDGLFGFLTWKCLEEKSQGTPTVTVIPRCLVKDKTCVLGGSSSCCTGLSCIPDKNSNIAGLSCQQSGSDSSTPTPLPFDLGKIKVEDSKPWISFDEEKSSQSSSPSSEPLPGAIGTEKTVEPGKLNEECDPFASVVCQSGLECRPQDDSLASSAYVCQVPPKQTSGDTPVVTPTPTPDPNELSFKATDLPVDDLAKAAGGNGFGISNNGFIKDKKGNLYLAFQQPVVKKIDQYKFQTYYSTSLAVSKDDGKTWTFLKTQNPLPDNEYSSSTFELPTNKQCVSLQEACDATIGKKNCGSFSSVTKTGNSGVYTASITTGFDGAFNPYVVLTGSAPRAGTYTGSHLIGSVPGGFSFKQELNSGYLPYCATKNANGEYSMPYVSVSFPGGAIDPIQCICPSDPKWGCHSKPGRDWIPGVDCDNEIGSGASLLFEIRSGPPGIDRTDTLYYSDFQGMANTAKDGVYLFYSIYSQKSHSRSREITTYENSSDLRVIIADGEQPRDVLVSRGNPSNLKQRLRFSGYSNGVYFFTEYGKLYAYREVGQEFSDLRTKWTQIGNAGFKLSSAGPLYYFTKYISLPDGNVIGFNENTMYVKDDSGNSVNVGKYRVSQNVSNGYFKPVEVYSDSPSGHDVTIADAVSDENGNLHMLFTNSCYYSDTALCGGYKFKRVYQLIPASVITPELKPDIRGVYLFTQKLFSGGDCPSCVEAQTWLSKVTAENAIPNFQVDPIVDGGPLRAAIESAMTQKKYPFVIVDSADSQTPQVVFGFDSIRLAKKLGAKTDLHVFSVPTASSFQGVAGRIAITSDGVPMLFSTTDKGFDQFTYGDGQWTQKTLFSTPNPVDTPTFISYDKTKYSSGSENIYVPSFISASAGSALVASGNPLSGVSDLRLLLFTKKTVGALLENFFQGSSMAKTQVNAFDNNYDLYSFDQTIPLDPEPSAGSVLSELVPLQKLKLPVPLNSDQTPSLSVSSDLSGGSASVEMVQDEDSGTFSALVTLDARTLWQGGLLNIPGDQVSGKVTASFGSQRVDMPFTVLVKHIPPNQLAYASPERVSFYTVKDKSVKKTIFLTNNYPQTMTFACGSVFSRAVPGHSIAMVEILPVASTTACSVTINTYPTGQQMVFQREELAGDLSWAEEDVLAESAKVQSRQLRFTDCSNGYCNCGQATAALTDFENSVLAKASAINSQASSDSLPLLYPSGYSQTTILRTGVFDDLDDERLGTCSASVAGWGADLLPGRVYQISINVPQSDGRLFLESRTPDTPKELLKAFSYATPDGVVSDQDTFVRMIEVR
ncbi:hypothetical protein HY994_02265 [Candidatus Micrarchaeota archaeon]|nr:hypothetical protein [Candidatus Micrarchaeota archaeon]